MDISTGNWFEYLREEVLKEGLRDIGLPEFVIDYLEDAMPDASEKARLYIANNWKGSIGRMAGAYTTDSLKFEVVSYLIDNALFDYIQAPGDKVGEEPTARTITPHTVDGMVREPSTRVQYDDETIKQNEQIKFVVINLRNTVGRPMGTWRKAFMKAVKALSKAGLPSEKVESIKEYLRSLYGKNFHFWINEYSELVAFLNDDATNYELIKGEENINEAAKIAINYLENKEDPENIIHTFDDGSYWYNLNVSSCDVEASRMGHCGSDSRGTLVSLRKKQGKRRESSSYITMTYNDYDNTIYQIKGRQNDAPPEETWDHIAWFINNMGVDSVEETGEHSGDVETIQEMIEYLASQTNASFHGSIEDRIEKAEEYCRGVEMRFYDNIDELERSGIGYSVEDGDMGGDVYVYMNAEYSFEIDLGWTEIVTTDDGFEAPDPQDFEPIPRTYSGMRDFASELGIDDMMYSMPGDDGDYEIEVRMLVGAQPEGQDLGDDAPATAHLTVRLMTSETASADNDGEVPEFDDFADSMLVFDEDDAPTSLEEVRQALAAGGYMAKTAYDRAKEELVKLSDLDKWHVKTHGGSLEFDWTADDGQPLHYYATPLPTEVFLYGMGTGNIMGGASAQGIFREIFGYGKSYRYANTSGIMDTTISGVFSAKLSNLVSNSLRTTVKGQEEFSFGEKYKAVDPVKALADDTDFVVFMDEEYNRKNLDAYPTLRIAWLYRMRVGPNSPENETTVIKEIAQYLNEKPELVTQAANETIAFYLEAYMESINRRKEKVLNNEEAQSLINRIKAIYGPIINRGADDSDGDIDTYEVATTIYTIAEWFEENYDRFNELARYVMIKEFLAKMATRRFRAYGNMGSISRNTGAPVMFGEYIASYKNKLGAKTPQPNPQYTTTQESVEQQIARIERLLEEQAHIVEEVDVRLYKLEVDAIIASDRAAKTKQLQDQLRGIENVTTVSAKESIETPTGEKVRFTIKFALVGQQSRVEFVANYLIPAMNLVAGVEVINQQGVGWSAPVEVTPGKKLSEIQTLDEYGFGSGYGGSVQSFGGMAGQLGSQRYTQGTKMTTPRPMIQQLIDDWAEGGVMGYDVPAHTNDMRYHVMFPVEELLPFMDGKEYRGDMKDFEGRYQQFIKDGPTAPVYLAVGQINQTAKVTGGEDLIWFAKKAGLEELPVFISYQRQV